MTDDQTLLAHLAPRLGYHPENIAVEALGYILSSSKEALSALDDMLGAEVGPIRRVRTQVAYSDGCIPDLAGFDSNGVERVLIEAKFGAGLTENQPAAYLEHLGPDLPSALLVVAPAARSESLWAVLRELTDEAAGLEWRPLRTDQDSRGASVGGNRRLMLTSWATLLRRIASSVPEGSDTAEDVRQLLGLTQRMDKEVFLPLRQAELGPDFPRRMRGLVTLIRKAIDRVCADRWADTSGLKTGIGGGEEGDWGPYFLLGRGGRAGAWLGWNFELWAKKRETPLWLTFTEEGWTSTLKLDVLRRRLEPLKNEDPPGMIDDGHRLLVPIALPVGVEEEAVLDAVVARLEAVASMISESEP